MQSTNVDVRQSVIDLTRIYKPKPNQVESFVEWYVKRYRIPKGYEKELQNIVLSEIAKMQEGAKE